MLFLKVVLKDTEKRKSCLMNESIRLTITACAGVLDQQYNFEAELCLEVVLLIQDTSARSYHHHHHHHHHHHIFVY